MKKTTENGKAAGTKKSDYETSKDTTASTDETVFSFKDSVFKSRKAFIIYAIIGLVFIATVSFMSASVIEKNQKNVTSRQVKKKKFGVSEPKKIEKSNRKTVIKNGKQFVVLSKKEVSRYLSLLKVMLLRLKNDC